MPKVLFCNSFEITSTKEIFLLLFRFIAPDAHEETVYVAISPSGAATLHELLGKEVESFVQKFGNIVMENWQTEKPNRNCNSHNPAYLS
jgi:hypothetical protein